MGDVLRTTALLAPLRKKFPESAITWVTLPPSLDLFLGNPLVYEVLDYRSEALPRILTEEFDLILNPDAEKLSSSLAVLARGREKLGFGLDARGTVFCFNKEAERWLEMGAFDHRKRANQSTYQEIVLNICQLPNQEGPLVLHLLPEEVALGETFASEHLLREGKKVLGLYTGAGERWRMKRWPESAFRELIVKILRETDFTIVIYGGPDVRDRNARLYAPFSDSGRVVHAGVDNPLRTFLALINLSDLVVTGDTLALHAALALGKKVVGLFGPTSAAEIEMYGRGRKLSGTVDCLCCYHSRCTQSPTCMETLTPDVVFDAVKELVGA